METALARLLPNAQVAPARLHEAMATYGSGVRAHFLGRLSRAQVAAMGENCRRIGVALKSDPTPARLGRV